MNQSLKDLISRIDEFIDRHSLSDSKFGTLAVKDSALIYSIKTGNRSPTLRTIEKIENFMSGYKKTDGKTRKRGAR